MLDSEAFIFHITVMGGFIHHRIVEFHETDAAGLVHFSNYFRYAESAEHALFRSIGYPMMNQEGAAFYGWPRVRAQAKYSAPLSSGDEMRIELSIDAIKDKAIEFQFRIYRAKDDVLAGKGSFTTMHVHIDGLTRDMRSELIPDSLRSRLEPYLMELRNGE